MKSPAKIVISASRRTDIPAFYMGWFMQGIGKGFFEVTNPYNRKVAVVPAVPDKVHTIVFWSKNFGPFLDGGYGEMLLDQGFNLFFNFTINSDSFLLEPHVPPLEDRLEQLDDLCRRFKAEAVNWRFDPICSYETKGEGTQNNLKDFAGIAQRAAQNNVRCCITSFMDDYPKIRKRIRSMPGFAFVDLSIQEQKKIVRAMEKELATTDMKLHLCCEKELLKALPAGSDVSTSSCIPNRLLMEIYGGRLSLKRDAGQRVKIGCGCRVSADIGSYHLHPCYHNCLFCYANPEMQLGE